MTENRRIALNIAATYGRSLFALVCGLFTSRWVLMALGQSDYGLYGVSGTDQRRRGVRYILPPYNKEHG